MDEWTGNLPTRHTNVKKCHHGIEISACMNDVIGDKSCSASSTFSAMIAAYTKHSTIWF